MKKIILILLIVQTSVLYAQEQRNYLVPTSNMENYQTAVSIIKSANQRMIDNKINIDALQQEIKQLKDKIKGNEQMVFDFEKDIAIADYKSNVLATVGYGKTLGFDQKTMDIAQEQLKQREDNLKNQYGLSSDKINQLKQNAINNLYKGVPYLDWGLGEEGDLDDDGNENYANAGIVGQSFAIHITASVYTKPKEAMKKQVSVLKDEMDKYVTTINNDKEKVETLTTQNEQLKKVFQKYKEITVNSDNYKEKIIQFGNECENVLKNMDKKDLSLQETFSNSSSNNNNSNNNPTEGGHIIKSKVASKENKEEINRKNKFIPQREREHRGL